MRGNTPDEAASRSSGGWPLGHLAPRGWRGEAIRDPRLLRALRALAMTRLAMPVITIFGSSQVKEGEVDYERGRELGRGLAQVGYTTCNGGYGGMMEATARGAKERGGKTIGVTTEDFGGPANRWIDREIRMKKWSERLFKLIELGDAYVVFGGGTGTLVELFVVWEMSNKKFFKKPLVVFGDQSQELIKVVREWKQVIYPSNFSFAGDIPEILKILVKAQYSRTINEPR